MLQQLKSDVLQANLLLPKYNLVTFTWGNVSCYDRQSGVVAIKPSGVAYEQLSIEDIVLLDINGKHIQGHLNPSSDTATHLALYKAFDDVNAVVHTHSTWATIMAQAGQEIPPFGTTHADYFYGTIPITRQLSQHEVENDYELHTGNVIVQRMRGISPLEMPACLVHGHGPFAWASTIDGVVHNAVVLEEVARMAYHTMQLGRTASIPKYLLDKHYLRKHGKNAYYGNK